MGSTFRLGDVRLHGGRQIESERRPGFRIAEVTTAGLLIAPSRTRFNPTRQAALRNRTNGEFLGRGIGWGTDNHPLGKILNRQVDTRDCNPLPLHIPPFQGRPRESSSGLSMGAVAVL
jgi:hypothetical protein